MLENNWSEFRVGHCKLKPQFRCADASPTWSTLCSKKRYTFVVLFVLHLFYAIYKIKSSSHPRTSCEATVVRFSVFNAFQVAETTNGSWLFLLSLQLHLNLWLKLNLEGTVKKSGLFCNGVNAHPIECIGSLPSAPRFRAAVGVTAMRPK